MGNERIDDREAWRVEWLNRLSALLADFRRWVEPSGWVTRQVTKSVTEPDLGRYEVPVLLMEREDVELVLCPLARTVPGADGVVDLNLMPAYDDVASLCRLGGQWYIQSVLDSDHTQLRSMELAKRLPLDESQINRVLDSVAAHA